VAPPGTARTDRRAGRADRWGRDPSEGTATEGGGPGRLVGARGGTEGWIALASWDELVQVRGRMVTPFLDRVPRVDRQPAAYLLDKGGVRGRGQDPPGEP
jgi:hypothetical protein